MAESITVRVPSNIALIKYWGKKDEKYNTPLNDSVSLTIDDLYAETTIKYDYQTGKDSVVINGQNVDLTTSPRFQKCFEEVRKLLRKKAKIDDKGEVLHPVYSFYVTSTTNFPVGAGLASSAAGFAAIAFAMGKLFDFDKKAVSRMARLGSGSACRSICEGLAHWKTGIDECGSDSFALSIAPISLWESLRAIILVLDDSEKKIGSTIGMQRTASTSTLIELRVKKIVPKRVEEIREAFEKNDFEELGRIIMMDSNQFHALCLDTYPPIKYLNNDSWKVIQLIHKFNEGGIRAAYTFDAGPNACLFTTEKNMDNLITAIKEHFYLENITVEGKVISQKSQEDPNKSKVLNMIQSTVGNGPRVVS
ncbi:unnamed protein product [Auanema sp. JU1783]|nr:unnamed protein product [Auanema sp. JU1783]